MQALCVTKKLSYGSDISYDCHKSDFMTILRYVL